MYLVVGIFGYLSFYHVYSVSDFPQLILQAHYGYGNAQVIIVMLYLGYIQYSNHGFVRNSTASVPLPRRYLLSFRLDKSHPHSHSSLHSGFQ